VHEQFSSLATRLIHKNGRLLKIISYGKPVDEWDPAAKNSRSEDRKDVIGVTTEFEVGEKDNDLKERTAKVFLIDTNTSGLIDTSMKLWDSADDVTYSILEADPLQPGTNNILYTVYVGK